MLHALLRSPRPLLVVAAIAAPLALSACTADSSSSKNYSGSKKEVQTVITKLGDLADDRNASEICSSLFTPALQSEFAKIASDGRCSTAVLRAVRNADYTRLVADSITLNGADAKATEAEAYIKVSKDGPKRGITLARADVKSPWKISAFQAKVTGTTPQVPTLVSTTPAPTSASTTTP